MKGSFSTKPRIMNSYNMTNIRLLRQKGEKNSDIFEKSNRCCFSLDLINLCRISKRCNLLEYEKNQSVDTYLLGLKTEMGLFCCGT